MVDPSESPRSSWILIPDGGDEPGGQRSKRTGASSEGGGEDPTDPGQTGHDNPGEWDGPWPLKEPREVLSDRRLRVPPLAQERIVGDGPAPQVAWNYDPSSDYVFISVEPARKSAYEFADYNSVEEPHSEWPKIRAPAALPDRILEQFEVKGTYMVYLASEEMLTDDNPSAWLLSWTQFTRMIPDDDGDIRQDDVGSAVSQNPGFMPPSPF